MTTKHGCFQVRRVADGQDAPLKWACFLHLFICRPSSSLFDMGGVIKARCCKWLQSASPAHMCALLPFGILDLDLSKPLLMPPECIALCLF